MRKIQLTEMIVDYLAGGDAPSDVRGRYHGAMIDQYVNIAYNDLIYNVYVEGQEIGDYSQLDSFARAFRAITVSDDGDRDLKYAILPFPPVQLPDNMGIRLICPNDDPTTAFAYLDNNSVAVFSALEVSSVDDLPGFWIEKMDDNEYRVYFDNPGDVLASIMAKLILPLGQYDDFDEVPMPAGKDMHICDLIVKRLREKPMEDLINDNVPKT